MCIYIFFSNELRMTQEIIWSEYALSNALSMHQAMLNVCITGDTNMLINGVFVFICVVHILVN